MNRHERRAAAQKSKKSAKSSGASTPAALVEAGRQHMAAGRSLEAQLCCQQALEAHPNHIDSLHLLGLLSLQAKQYDHAIEWISRANRQDVKADHLFSLGVALEQQGLPNEAFKAFDEALKLRPDDTELLAHHGNALMNLRRPADALSSYQHLVKLNPGHAEAAYGCGCLLFDLKRFEEALSYFNQSVELQPDNPALLNQRGRVLFALKRFEEALADHRRAHALDPNNAESHNDIGASLQRLRQDEEALSWFDKAIRLRPDFVVAWTNKASSLHQMGRLNEAFTIYSHVKVIDPDNAEAVWNLSLLNLLTGNFEAGWAGREVRWKSQSHPRTYPHFTQPMWLGDGDIAGKTILVYEDEGLGDTIQFARYIPMLAARGARVILAVEDPLHPLLSKLPDVSRCVSKSVEALPEFDLHCPVCSLPLAFGTRLETIPSGTSYLPRPSEARVRTWEDRLQARLGPRNKLRVGLVWSGSLGHVNDHNRSIPLSMLSRLLDIDASFISLQKDVRPGDKAPLEQSNIADLTSHLTDFAETAALIACLDLVITVDTSVAHLAGALDAPTWLLLPTTPDYRWLLDRDDSPWYPSMKLFRQSQTRDYGEVLDRLHAELTARVAAH